MRRLSRFVPVMLLAAWPALASAETGGPGRAMGEGAPRGGRGVGVVTTLAGNAIVARAALPTPEPLHFKDAVFVRDRISTAEKSIVRVLLGGKALVTVRELSALTITEETGRSTVDLSSGKIAMGVLRQRMRPGEVIQIRTPNAIAAVRGTVLVVELIPGPPGPGGASQYTTKVHVLHGLVEVSDPNNPGAPAANVGTLQSWSRTGNEPFSLVPFAPTTGQQVFADLRSAPQIIEGPNEFMSAITTREQVKAIAVAEFLAPEINGAAGGGDGSEPPTGPTTRTTDTASPTDAPVVPLVAGSRAAPASAPASSATGPARISYNGQTDALRGNLYTLSNGQTDPLAVPILEAISSSLSVGQNLMEVTGGGTVTSTGSAALLYLESGKLSVTSLLAQSGGARMSLIGTLFQDQNGGIDVKSDALRLSGGASLAGTGGSALVDLAGSTAVVAGGLLSVSGGAVMDLVNASAPLLRLTKSAALTTERSLVDLSGGAAVKLSQLTALTASSLTIKGHALALAGGATMTVAGDLFRIAGGSTLSITNGALLSLSGGSTLSVTGALVNFSGTGNTLSITNNLCANGCTTIMIGNRPLPVLVTGGGSISLTNNAILNLAGNRLDITAGSAVISVSSGAQVKQGQ